MKDIARTYNEINNQKWQVESLWKDYYLVQHTASNPSQYFTWFAQPHKMYLVTSCPVLVFVSFLEPMEGNESHGFLCMRCYALC